MAAKTGQINWRNCATVNLNLTSTSLQRCNTGEHRACKKQQLSPNVSFWGLETKLEQLQKRRGWTKTCYVSLHVHATNLL